MGKKKLIMNKFNLNDLKFYYGIFYVYCVFLIGKGIFMEVFDYVRYNGFNFLILIDYNNYLIKLVRVKGNELSKWEVVKYLVLCYNKKYDNFLVIIGFESKINFFGDINIVNFNRFFIGIVNNF